MSDHDLLALQDYYFYAVVNKINHLRMKVMYTVTAMLWYKSLDNNNGDATNFNKKEKTNIYNINENWV